MTMLAVALVLVAGVAASWYFEQRAAPATSVASASPSSYRVRITRDGRELASFDLAALQAIGVRSVVVQGGSEQGPALLDVLRKAGADSFSAVTVIGAGTHDKGRLDLAAADIGPDTVLDVAKRGTVKIAGPRIPRDKRVRDIKEIQVR
jgi:hypothetical protein